MKLGIQSYVMMSILSLFALISIQFLGVSFQISKGHAYRDQVVRHYENNHLTDGYKNRETDCESCRHERNGETIWTHYDIMVPVIKLKKTISLKSILILRY